MEVESKPLSIAAMQTQDKDAIAGLKLPGPLEVLELAMTKDAEETEPRQLPPMANGDGSVALSPSRGPPSHVSAGSPMSGTASTTSESLPPNIPWFLQVARAELQGIPDIVEIVPPQYFPYQGMDSMQDAQMPMAPNLTGMVPLQLEAQHMFEPFHDAQAFQMPAAPPAPPPAPSMLPQWQAIQDEHFAHAQLVPITFTPLPDGLPTRQGNTYHMQMAGNGYR
jgi:hypothetical protein